MLKDFCMIKPQNILVSGGWGYGNLGDDAILIATIKLLRCQFPDAIITVLTYNVEETTRFSYVEDVRYLPSVHRYLVDCDATNKYRVTNAQYKPAPQSTMNKALYKLSRIPLLNTKRKAYLRYKGYSSDFSALPIVEAFKEADLFVLGGGGYFNDEWPDKVYSHTLELEIASAFKLKTLVIGQSIGPFREEPLRKIAVSGLLNANVLSIRDVDSYDELKSYGFDPFLIPDTAISDVEYSFDKKDIICVIIGGYGLTADNLEQLYKSVNRNAESLKYSVRIMVSRLWETDINLAFKFNGMFKNSPHQVELIIPDSLAKLQRCLGESRLLISQNLHGLIIAWRAGVPGISLNNGRKFVSFMSQTKQSDRLVPLSILTEEILSAAIRHANSDSSGFVEQRHSIASSIIEKFEECLNQLS